MGTGRALIALLVTCTLPIRTSQSALSLSSNTTLNKTLQVSNSTNLSSNSSIVFRGWVSSPNGRGTIDILSNCLFTILLCTWTALHLNLPAPNEGFWTVNLRKARWMIQTVVGPEFVLYFAVGQRYEAKESVVAFRKLNYPQWTLRHGFYANMGGFVLKPRNGTSFPITARQLHYLVAERLLPFPEFGSEEVWDKSKADGIAKFLTCLQILWLGLQVFGRLAQHLPITTLELTTMSYVLCALATYTQWAQKPLDIETPTTLPCAKSMEEILIHAGDRAATPYRQTPLDFIDNQFPSWCFNVQPYLGFRLDPRPRPLQRFPNDRFPMIGLGLEAAFYGFATFAFAAIHVAGWNLNFPTEKERVFWRVASLVIMGVTIAIWAIEGIQDGHRYGRWQRWRTIVVNRQKASDPIRREVAMMAADFVPLWEFVLMVPVSLIYASARTYVLLEVFIGLRALPANVFDSVQWSNFIPHW